MECVGRFFQKRLKPKVNTIKSEVEHPRNRSFFGYTFTGGIRPNRLKKLEKSLQRFKAKVGQLTRRKRGISVQDMIKRLNVFLSGWVDYFGF